MAEPTATALNDAIHSGLLEFTEDIYGQIVRFQRGKLVNFDL